MRQLRELCLAVCQRDEAIVGILRSFQHYPMCPCPSPLNTTRQATAAAVCLPTSRNEWIFAIELHQRYPIRRGATPRRRRLNERRPRAGRRPARPRRRTLKRLRNLTYITSFRTASTNAIPANHSTAYASHSITAHEHCERSYENQRAPERATTTDPHHQSDLPRPS